MTIFVHSEIPFSKNSYHIETKQLICKVDQLTGFYMTTVFTVFRVSCNESLYMKINETLQLLLSWIK